MESLTNRCKQTRNHSRASPFNGEKTGESLWMKVNNHKAQFRLRQIRA
jgi:hypothetical protein